MGRPTIDTESPNVASGQPGWCYTIRAPTSNAHPVVVHEDNVHLDLLSTLERADDGPFGDGGAVCVLGEVEALSDGQDINEHSLIKTKSSRCTADRISTTELTQKLG